MGRYLLGRPTCFNFESIDAYLSLQEIEREKESKGVRGPRSSKQSPEILATLAVPGRMNDLRYGYSLRRYHLITAPVFVRANRAMKFLIELWDSLTKAGKLPQLIHAIKRKSKERRRKKGIERTKREVWAFRSNDEDKINWLSPFPRIRSCYGTCHAVRNKVVKKYYDFRLADDKKIKEDTST
ncbi:hypothetical protein M0802_003218 [Mischocyttarus mexicanus]|nr:hypothetical protein M0802_003218 [Mischocyttarus mexicanus]